jgi:hypothetical protein
MRVIDLHLNGDGCWPDLVGLRDEGKYQETTEPISMAMLMHGTEGGRASVTIRMNLPDGTVALGQTSLRLLATAVRAMIAATGEEP